MGTDTPTKPPTKSTSSTSICKLSKGDKKTKSETNLVATNKPTESNGNDKEPGLDPALIKKLAGGYDGKIKKLELKIQDSLKRINQLIGVGESDTGLAPSSSWDLSADRQVLQREAPLVVGRVEHIYKPSTTTTTTTTASPNGNNGNSSNAPAEDSESPESPRYLVKCLGRRVVELEANVADVDVEEGMRVALSPGSFKITLPLPPGIDPSVAAMQVEEKPDVTYADVGGCKDEIAKLREVLEMPLLTPEKFIQLGIDPPKGVLLFGPPGTGKTLCARAVANRTDACFIRVIGSELVRKYNGEGPKMIRDLFAMARTKRACIIFFDEIDAIGGARQDDGQGGNNEIQRTMLELINQLDGFDPRGNIKVLMATNRPDTLDPALVRPGRLDRRVEFGLPDVVGRTQIFRIHATQMNADRNIRFDLLSRLCPNTTGADIRSICTEAGMFAIRERRKMATEKDFLEAVNKVVKNYAKFSATPSYMTHN